MYTFLFLFLTHSILLAFKKFINILGIPIINIFVYLIKKPYFRVQNYIKGLFEVTMSFCGTLE